MRSIIGFGGDLWCFGVRAWRTANWDGANDHRHVMETVVSRLWRSLFSHPGFSDGLLGLLSDHSVTIYTLTETLRSCGEERKGAVT